MLPANEESLFFIPIDSICHRPAITCSPELNLVEMARIMKLHNISGIIAVEGDKPVGIVSLRDLRNLLAETADFATLTVRDIMKRRLITVRCSDYLFKAIFMMAKHNIHRLIVVNECDCLVGVLTDTDLLRIQTRSPLYLVQEIEAATSIEQLQTISRKMTGMLQYAVATHADAQSLIQLIAHFHDAFTQRIIVILDTYHNIRLPSGAAYLALGSEGRGEQTLRTDQDSAIVYDDAIAPEKLADIQLFAEHLVAALESIGVPRCPGNMMVSNLDWCHSLSEWKHLIERWISMAGPEQTVHFGVFQDLRVLHGEQHFEEELRSYIRQCTHNHTVFFAGMAHTIINFKPPLGLFGRLLVSKTGDDSGKLDLKKGGLFTLTRGIGLIALETGILGGTTWEKMERLHHSAIISDGDLQTIKDAFTFLIKMRLEKQLAAIQAGKEADNLVDPLDLSEREREQLKSAFKGVNTLISLMRSRYQLDMMAR